MSNAVKATIVGTVIIGLFMVVSVKITTNALWRLARTTKEYVEVQKAEIKEFIIAEKRKAKEVYLEAAQTGAAPAPRAAKAAKK